MQTDLGKRATIAALAALLACACVSDGPSYVGSSTVRGPFIDATLVLPSGEWRFLFPRTETCTAMLTVEAPIRHSSFGGGFGRAVAPDGSQCTPAGIGTLHRWRRSRREGEMQPSSPARWEIIHEDPQAFLLRGRFGVASRLRLPNTFDVVALVPNDDVCGPVARSGNATLVFRQAGRRVLMLGQCPVLAVATPPEP